ncbi:MAG: ferric reductase-like transmembrane domain-containing protein [Candidatus Eremiobacteraeota bacterium]|nr:ferric reductase-like transmembrane domain-containing protein [Candidatus Eremiobacteraeota bacterium]
MTQLWLCQMSGYLALFCLLSSQAMAPLERLRRISRKTYLRWRRRLGITAAMLASLHTLIVWRTLFGGNAVDPFRETQWAQLGLAAWVLLLFLWLTSYSPVVRRLRIKNWSSLHRLAYAATFLALLHGLLAPWSNIYIQLGLLIFFLLSVALRGLRSKAIL